MLWMYPMFYRKTTGHKNAARLVKALYQALLHRAPEQEALTKFSIELTKNMSPLELIEGIVNSSEYKGIIHPGHVQDFEHTTQNICFIESKAKREIKNIIYFIPSINKPIGGVKVIIRHCEQINSFVGSNVSAKLFCPVESSPKLNWFNHSIATKVDACFDIASDFIIIPELWALRYGTALKNSGISYAIFVQNGYFLFHNVLPEDNIALEQLKEVYTSAVRIYTISNDTTECVKRAFKNCGDKITQLIPSVDTTIFHPTKNKENIITYMPRKLLTHSSWLINQLKLSEITNWEFIPIDKMTEEEVGKTLQKSRIFLSFSDQEGFALPPLEAALSGNIVIGYTGQAAAEYWSPPLFKEVKSGDLFDYLKNVSDTISELDTIKSSLPYDYADQITSLRLKYSKEKERLAIYLMLQELHIDGLSELIQQS